MGATTEEAMAALLLSFDQIYDEVKNRMTEIETLKSNWVAEAEKREATKLPLRNLQSENERLTKLYMESLDKMATQMEWRANCQSLKEELNAARNESLHRENEYRKEMESIKQDYVRRMGELEIQIRELCAERVANKATIDQLRQDLTTHRNHIEALTRRLGQVSSDVESRYHCEIQGLKDCLVVEQGEKNELNKKVEDLEKELLITRAKVGDQEQDMTSSRHVETLKQKIMKLRKENEVLRRQALTSDNG